ncbi:MAG: hypothetical protein IPK64_08105 [bacterium]|nr:hypothetical protein [bacterium]
MVNLTVAGRNSSYRCAWGGRVPLVLMWVLAATGAGAQEPPPTEPDSLVSGEVPPELQDAVGELDLADQPLPWRDLALMAVPSAAPAGEPERFAWVWRSNAAPAGPRHDARLDFQSGRWRARGALRVRTDVTPEPVGAGSVQLGPARLWAGHLTLRHGFGLTGSDPGRRGSLSADQGIGGISGGLAARTASGAGAGGLQAGVDLACGSWRLAGLGGVSGPSAGGPRWIARLERAVADTRWALAAGTDSAGSFLGGAGRLERDQLAINWEAAVLAPGDGRRAQALVVGAAWRPSPRLRLELLSGLADGVGRGTAAVLPGEARRGWAVRVAWRDRGAGALEILAQGSSGPEAQVAPKRRQAGVLEAGWERRTGGALSVHLRCRRTTRSDLAWSAREPWLPGTTGLPLVRTSLAAGVEHDDGSRRAALHWRSFTVTGSGTEGNRQLVAVTGVRRWPGGWEAWFDATTAWGEQVDLVRAVVPLPGLVTARHWGAWRAETLAGAGRRWGAVIVRAAVARRLPVAATSGMEEAVWEAWIEARASW